MNQSSPKTKTTNTQSVRLPMALYERVADLALREDVSMTNMIIRLITLGLGHQENFEDAVRRLFFRIVSKEELESITNGKAPDLTT